MAIQFHPEQGTIVVCDFSGFVAPEMVKRRPAIVVSPRLRQRDRLCTIVPLSTTPPNTVAPYHFKLYVVPVLPSPYNAAFHWVKADMLYTVSLDRLYLPFSGKDASGKRQYDVRVIDKDVLLKIQECILHALGLNPILFRYSQMMIRGVQGSPRGSPRSRMGYRLIFLRTPLGLRFPRLVTALPAAISCKRLWSHLDLA